MEPFAGIRRFRLYRAEARIRPIRKPAGAFVRPERYHTGQIPAPRENGEAVVSPIGRHSLNIPLHPLGAATIILALLRFRKTAREIDSPERLPRLGRAARRGARRAARHPRDCALCLFVLYGDQAALMA
jgi:hypothetical protein